MVVVVVVVETAVVCGSNSSPCVQAVFYSEDEGMEPEEPVAYRGLHTPVRSRLMLHALFFFLSPSPRASHTHTHTHTHCLFVGVCMGCTAYGRRVCAAKGGNSARPNPWEAEETPPMECGGRGAIAKGC